MIDPAWSQWPWPMTILVTSPGWMPRSFSWSGSGAQLTLPVIFR